MRHPFLKAKLILTALIAALVISGGALAYFASKGHGTAQAAVGAAVVDITSGTPSGQLYPGGGSGDVVAVIANQTPGAVHVSSLILDTSAGSSGFAVDAGHPACTTPALSFNGPQDNSGAGWTIPPRVGTADGALSVTLTGAVAMGTSSSNGCQGATFTVYLKAAP
jgi:hypothetical protein